jgi:hypothetical protein
MALIRHEIQFNLRDWLFNTVDQDTENILVNFDPANYNYDNLYVYLELDCIQANTVGNIYALTDDGVTRASITPYNTTRDLRRTSAATGLTAGVYTVTLSNYLSQAHLYMARMIILQDTGTSEVTDTVCYAPIGCNLNTTSITPTTNAGGHIWYYNSDNWSSSDATFYVDVTYYIDNNKGEVSLLLYKSTTSDGSYSLDTTIYSGAASETPELKSASFTPTDGYYYKIYVNVDSTKYTVSLLGGSIRVEMSNVTKIEKFETRHNISCQTISSTGGYLNAILWDEDEWDVSIQSYLEATGYGGSTVNVVQIEEVGGSTTPSAGYEVDISSVGWGMVRNSTMLAGMTDDTEYDLNVTA